MVRATLIIPGLPSLELHVYATFRGLDPSFGPPEHVAVLQYQDWFEAYHGHVTCLQRGYDLSCLALRSVLEIVKNLTRSA